MAENTSIVVQSGRTEIGCFLSGNWDTNSTVGEGNYCTRVLINLLLWLNYCSCADVSLNCIRRLIFEILFFFEVTPEEGKIFVIIRTLIIEIDRYTWKWNYVWLWVLEKIESALRFERGGRKLARLKGNKNHISWTNNAVTMTNHNVFHGFHESGAPNQNNYWRTIHTNYQSKELGPHV